MTSNNEKLNLCAILIFRAFNLPQRMGNHFFNIKELQDNYVKLKISYGTKNPPVVNFRLLFFFVDFGASLIIKF